MIDLGKIFALAHLKIVPSVEIATGRLNLIDPICSLCSKIIKLFLPAIFSLKYNHIIRRKNEISFAAIRLLTLMDITA